MKIKYMIKHQQVQRKVLMKNYQFRPNCQLSTQNKFIHVPIVLCAFVEKLHIKSIWTIVQKYKCLICKKTFFSDRTFQKHKCNCPPKRYPCPICKKDYSRKLDTDKHMKTHVPIRDTFTCHWCGCQCLTGKQLDLHIEQRHGNLI